MLSIEDYHKEYLRTHADILDEALANGDKDTVVGSVLENKISMAEMVLEISLDLVFVIFLGQYIILSYVRAPILRDLEILN